MNPTPERPQSGANPRYGRPGRIPGSVDVPAAALLDPETRELPCAETAAGAFAAVDADPVARVGTAVQVRGERVYTNGH